MACTKRQEARMFKSFMEAFTETIASFAKGNMFWISF